MRQRSLLHKLGHTLCKQSADREGFVILDAMIAATIFGVFMMAVMGMLMATYNNNRVAQDVTEASALAADALERLSSYDFNDADLQNNTLQLPDSEDGRYKVSAATSVNSIVDHTMTVTVTVSWQDRGRTRRVVINDILVDFI